LQDFLNVVSGAVAEAAGSAGSGAGGADHTGPSDTVPTIARGVDADADSDAVSGSEGSARASEGPGGLGSSDRLGSVNETHGDKVRVRETASRPRIQFEFKDGNAQTQMRLAGDTTYDYKYIVMPLRI
jgi:hypothetical protein